MVFVCVSVSVVSPFSSASLKMDDSDRPALHGDCGFSPVKTNKTLRIELSLLPSPLTTKASLLRGLVQNLKMSVGTEFSKDGGNAV
ncbi:hypothetical protein AMECASPLE_006577 [Ameca splendens]|uniref:Secreted protein n=1 Tax=Ameca splendens TaxID=208324 RepID=A0ABV1A688_9TELE